MILESKEKKRLKELYRLAVTEAGRAILSELRETCMVGDTLLPDGKPLRIAEHGESQWMHGRQSSYHSLIARIKVGKQLATGEYEENDIEEDLDGTPSY